MSESQRAPRKDPEAGPLPARVRPERRDPLGPILALGGRQLRTGTMMGIAGALIVHGAGAAQAATTLLDLAGFASSVRAHVQQRLRAEFDIQLDEPPPPPPEPEPPPPEPEEEKQPEPPPPVENAPPPEPGAPPPAAAEAANVLTAPADPEEPLDLTGEGFVVGTGETYAGGITASSGTSKSAVRDVRAAATGVGKAPAAAPVVPNPAPAIDRSRQPKPIGNLGALCSNMFPAEANAEGINHAVVTVSATIQPDGRAKNITVLRDPGSGFGGAARLCVARGRFDPGLDSAGRAVPKTLTFNIRFTR